VTDIRDGSKVLQISYIYIVRAVRNLMTLMENFRGRFSSVELIFRRYHLITMGVPYTRTRPVQQRAYCYELRHAYSNSSNAIYTLGGAASCRPSV